MEKLAYNLCQDEIYQLKYGFQRRMTYSSPREFVMLFKSETPTTLISMHIVTYLHNLYFCFHVSRLFSYSTRGAFHRGGNLDNYYSTEAPSKDKTLTVPVAHNMYMTSEPSDGTTTFVEKYPVSISFRNMGFQRWIQGSPLGLNVNFQQHITIENPLFMLSAPWKL